ncbi:MAG: MBL fold metallo-hydrolase [Pseudomonadota bacterium]
MTRFPVLLLAVVMVAGCTDAPAFRGDTSEHFDGTRFHNRSPLDQDALDVLRYGWSFMTQREVWPDRVPVSQQRVPQARVTDGLSVTFINHASFLIQVDGLNILTDPVYSNRVSPFAFAGPQRVHLPGVRLEDLPPIDVVLISHNHYDHLDEATLIQLARQNGTPPLILSGLGNGLLFDRLGLDNHLDLDWDDAYRVDGVTFTFVECRHRSGRGVADHFKTLWGSFVIETSRGNLYFAGDTAYGPHFAEAAATFGPFRLALLPIGAYEPRWFMKEVHLNPAEAVQAHIDLQAQQSVGIHYGTFQLTNEGIDDPLKDLEVARRKRQLSPESFFTLRVGETRRLPAEDAGVLD